MGQTINLKKKLKQGLLYFSDITNIKYVLKIRKIVISNNKVDETALLGTPLFALRTLKQKKPI